LYFFDIVFIYIRRRNKYVYIYAFINCLEVIFIVYKSYNSRRNSHRSPLNKTTARRYRSVSVRRRTNSTNTSRISVVSVSNAKKQSCERYRKSLERRTHRLNILKNEIDDLRTIISNKQADAVELTVAMNKRVRQYQECMREQQNGGTRRCRKL
jgi:hypothetical protein